MWVSRAWNASEFCCKSSARSASRAKCLNPRVNKLSFRCLAHRSDCKTETEGRERPDAYHRDNLAKGRRWIINSAACDLEDADPRARASPLSGNLRRSAFSQWTGLTGMRSSLSQFMSLIRASSATDLRAQFFSSFFFERRASSQYRSPRLEILARASKTTPPANPRREQNWN